MELLNNAAVIKNSNRCLQIIFSALGEQDTNCCMVDINEMNFYDKFFT